MKAGTAYRRSLVMFVCLLVASAAFAQAPATTFEPQVGQPGKDVVWVPTPQVLVDKMLDMAKVTPQDFLIDLGSGDGRTVITAAKRGLRAMGVEYNPDMVELSKRAAVKEGVAERATFVQADLFQTDLSQAQVITMFLLPGLNMQLRPTLLNLKPGTRIVSNTFDMFAWTADETQIVSENCTSWCTALLWIVPAKVQGTWKTAQGTLTLIQEFQFLTGDLNGTAISNGKMNGDQISFTAGATTYTGRVNAAGNAIAGANLNASKVD
jgi:hypothetical protein